MQRSKQIKTNSPSFNLRLIYPLFIPLCLCSYQNKQIENHPNGILPSPNLWNTRLYIFQKGCSSQRVWNILKRSAKETQTDCGHLDWFLLGSVIFCIFWSCSCCSDMEFVKCLHQWDSRNFQFYLRPIFLNKCHLRQIPCLLLLCEYFVQNWTTQHFFDITGYWVPSHFNCKKNLYTGKRSVSWM